MLRIFRKKDAILTDQELLQQFLADGELSQLGQLYERYVDMVYGVCLKYLQQEEQAEDAVMHIFEELVIKVKEHEIKQFRGWLYVLTRNHCLMALRKQNRNPTVSFEPEFMQSVNLEHPIDETEENQTDAHLRDCIDKLADQQKRCIELFYLAGHSYKEVAEQEQMPLGKVRSFIQNGRRNLKICLEKKGVKASTG